MRTSALVRVAATLTAVLASTLLAAPATADATALPVVVADTVTLYPGQTAELNVLANDSSPTGDDLALCRFPELDFLSDKIPAIMVVESGTLLGGKAGDLFVGAMPRARGTHVFNYFVCDTHHLVPASLTVVIREVEPVNVSKVRGKPGRLKVTNHNDQSIRLLYGHAWAKRPDGNVKVPAGATRTVRVQRHKIVWVALIGSVSGKAGMLASPGFAGQGVVRDIKLRGEPLPTPKKPDFRPIIDEEEIGRFSRWLG